MPAPAREGGYFQRGGTDIGRGYGAAGRELGRGTAGVGRSFGQGDFAEAVRSLGRGFGEFGRAVGVSTGQGFKNFGQAFLGLGKKLDQAASEPSKSEKRN